jgi:hypothetical protein
MVDNLKFNKILPSLSPARKINRTDSRGRNKQQTPFQESLAQKQKKKKKENPENAKRIMSRKLQADSKKADKCSHASESVRSKLIDIRV